MNRVVSVVHLIDDSVFRARKRGSAILFPSFGVGAGKVYHRGALAVHAHCFGEDTRCFFHIVHLESVELPFQVSADAARPCPVFAAAHGYRLLRLSSHAFVI